MLRRGGLLAHATSTIPGIAALPTNTTAIHRIQRFKQRQGPFVVLAASIRSACRLARYFTPALRRAMRESWPGRTTLIFPARPLFNKTCYRKGKLAVRVDADTSCRQLARHAGGYILSSSLNRKAEAWQRPNRQVWLHWNHYLDAYLAGGRVAGNPSTLYELTRSGMKKLR